jgi:hypothetical protein
VWNNGMSNYNGAVAVLRGGFFTGRGGVDAYGIASDLNGARLEAEGVTVLAEDGSSSNHGLVNDRSAVTTLRGGSFTARGGAETYGIAIRDSGTTLEAVSVIALGDDGSDNNYGLITSDSITVTLRGSAFTGRGGDYAYGIYSGSGNPTLEAVSVTALGENGSSSNCGLYIATGAAMADSSQFTGSSNGLYLESGTVYLGVSQLDGGATNSSGTLTCFQVYDGSYGAYTCP